MRPGTGLREEPVAPWQQVVRTATSGPVAAVSGFLELKVLFPEL